MPVPDALDRFPLLDFELARGDLVCGGSAVSTRESTSWPLSGVSLYEKWR
jgi:hypothetical protein